MIFFLVFVLLFRLGREYFFTAPLLLNKGDKIVIRSCLEEQPQLRGDTQSFVLREVRVNTARSGLFNYGDCLMIQGKLDSYVSTFKVGREEFFYLEEPEIIEWRPDLSKAGLISLKKFGFWLQTEARRIYERFLPEPIASLVSGIVLGAKSRLSTDFYQKLQNTGTLHIIVASGYNLTVISQIPVDFLAWFIGRKAALLFGGVLVWLYVLVAGSQPPVIRAAIIVTFIYLAQFSGRKFNVWRAFAVVVWLMLVINPGLLTGISFQLSISAMFGLLFFEKKWERLRKIPLVGKGLAESLSAQIMVLPIIGYHFGQVSWASPLINMLILPLVPYLMILGLAALLGLVFSWLALPFLYLVYPLGWLLVKLIDFFGEFSFLQFSFSFPWWLVVVYYLVIFMFFRHKDSPEVDEN
ncbi:ComEC/Rec2 family competence protein [Candidatus Shapirobacteria bacterium]|nr:ComEC/Rec2 family competence protein [Candidatus Shapirobacteria bacterium]